jgi:hypothetical protein
VEQSSSATGKKRKRPRVKKHRAGKKSRGGKKHKLDAASGFSLSLLGKLSKQGDVYESRTFSTAADTNRSSTGWNGVRPSVKARSVIDQAWAEGRALDFVKDFIFIPCDLSVPHLARVVLKN